MFTADTAYSTPAFPAEGVRLLSLFRFWNDVRYYYPYLDVNGGDWNDVLTDFIPRMIAATDAVQYHLAVAELTARVNDAHVSAGSQMLSSVWGYRFPAFEARFIDGKIVVWKPSADSTLRGDLRRGDVITHINDERVTVRWRDLERYVAAGNDAVRNRKIVSMVLRGKDNNTAYTIERDGKSFVTTVPMARIPSGPTPMANYPVSEQAKLLPGTNIGYINLGDLNVAQVDSAMAIVKGTDGLVLDVRNYPRGTMYAIATHLNLEPRPFVKFTAVDPMTPGQILWRPVIPAGRPGGNPDAYRGRVAILVDERTQSHAEFTTMALQTAPQNRVIGSQTAGADGNITYINLPGGIRTLFTGLGVFYPDGRPTQRIGIVPDIVVRPTIAGIRAGKDEVLERAIGYVKTGR
jgi:carboxyl-terminal processing protease